MAWRGSSLFWFLLITLSVEAREDAACRLPKTSSSTVGESLQLVQMLSTGVLVDPVLQPKSSSRPAEILIEREVRLTGMASFRKAQVALEVRIPRTGELAVRPFWIEEHSGYRGVEVKKIAPTHVILLSRDQKEVRLNLGDQKWVKLLVVSEKSDRDYLLIEKLRQISSDRYFNAVVNEDRWSLGDWWKSVEAYENRQRIDPAFIRNLRGVKLGSSSLWGRPLGLKTDSCSLQDIAKRKQEILGGQKDLDKTLPTEDELETSVDGSSFIMWNCLTETNDDGVCCDDKCVKKQGPPAYDSCGSGVDECGRANSLYFYDYRSCRLLEDKDLPHGSCYHGVCQPCVREVMPCEKNVGHLVNGVCQYDPRPDGFICGKDRVCLQGSCKQFSTLIEKGELDQNETLLRLAAQELASESEAGGGPDSCTEPGAYHGRSCVVPFTSGFKRLGYCYLGQCRVCQRESPQKLEGIPGCPESRLWPDRKGTRLSCSQPDICVY